MRATSAFVAHHRNHARAFAALAGDAALSAAPAAVTDALGPLSPLASEDDAVAFLHGLESRLAATQQFLLGGLLTVPAISLTAATLPVECQHTAVLGGLLSLPLAETVPAVQGTTGHLTAADYPIP